MTIMGASHKRTICEVLREIQDVISDDMVITKLIEAEHMAKRMSAKMIEYNKDVFNDFWEENEDYELDILRRMETQYKTMLSNYKKVKDKIKRAKKRAHHKSTKNSIARKRR